MVIKENSINIPKCRRLSRLLKPLGLGKNQARNLRRNGSFVMSRCTLESVWQDSEIRIQGYSAVGFGPWVWTQGTDACSGGRQE